jgi:hypothetical protein
VGLAALLVLGDVTEARACGGCFVPPANNTLVTGHQMILSVRQDSTTLWDQIQYDGSLESFAWVLPINRRGGDRPVVRSPLRRASGSDFGDVVEPYSDCSSSSALLASSSYTAMATGPGNGGVDVFASQTVGPYDTVQLSATDSVALTDWLDENGFALPPELSSTIPPSSPGSRACAPS